MSCTYKCQRTVNQIEKISKRFGMIVQARGGKFTIPLETGRMSSKVLLWFFFLEKIMKLKSEKQPLLNVSF